MRRPREATGAAVIAVTLAAWSVLQGVLFFAGVIELPMHPDLKPELSPTFLRMLTAASCLAGAAIWATIGVGLLRLRRWARTLAIFLVALGVLVTLPFVVVTPLAMGIAGLVGQLAWWTASGLMVWLLLQASVKQAFGVPEHQPRAQAEIKKPPAGVKVLAALCLCWAMTSVLLGLLSVLGIWGPGGRFPSEQPKLDDAMVSMMRVGMLVGSVLWALLLTALGLGLWKLKNWARIASIVLAMLSLLIVSAVLMPTLLPVILMGPRISLPYLLLLMITLVFVGAPALVIGYLLRNRVRRAFGTT